MRNVAFVCATVNDVAIDNEALGSSKPDLVGGNLDRATTESKPRAVGVQIAERRRFRADAAPAAKGGRNEDAAVSDATDASKTRRVATSGSPDGPATKAAVTATSSTAKELATIHPAPNPPVLVVCDVALRAGATLPGADAHHICCSHNAIHVDRATGLQGELRRVNVCRNRNITAELKDKVEVAMRINVRESLSTIKPARNDKIACTRQFLRASWS
jgi:hypothetical protein